MSATRQLLVGFDGSLPARVALRRAARIAGSDHASLTVVLAIDVPRLVGTCVLTGATLPLHEIERDANDTLRSAVAELPSDISVISHLVLGPAGPGLAQEANRICADAILIGSRCGITSRLTGGVAGYLRRHAHAPVIVVRSAQPRRPGHPATSQSKTVPPAGGTAVRPV
ncbi:universal stress protein [Conexibacter sp. DBS9H8]|uniref:universal stress protein n=1 Tax=Conexibacter sp. DBS9H8 TaxID=2937801 RepID=UPI00200DAED4|nr:universal stress protein [Conexibacter sp. DBS9H8]